MKKTTAIIITIGDELLYGQTIDTNSAWIGIELSKIGVTLRERIAIGDDHDDIVNTMAKACDAADVVIVTGGLGPTRDDITKKALADFMGVEMHFNQPTFEIIQGYFKKWGREMQPAHREQCYMPDTVTLIPNHQGTAPGMWFDYKSTSIISMPGVPYEMKGIMKSEGLKRIQALSPGYHILHAVLRTAGAGETFLAEEIESIIQTFPRELTLAYLPGLASVRIRLTVQGSDRSHLESILLDYKTQIESKLEKWIYGYEEQELEEALGVVCKEKGIKIGTAESCTGGLIGHLITGVPGSSEYYEGSIISYSNEIKQAVLGVQSDTLKEHGAVSKETVVEMVQGTIKQLGVDVAVAVSGIAGPGGGTAEKPVGTVWIAVGDRNRIIAKKWQLSKNREINIRYSATAALNQMRLFILDRMTEEGNVK